MLSHNVSPSVQVAIKRMFLTCRKKYPIKWITIAREREVYQNDGLDSHGENKVSFFSLVLWNISNSVHVMVLAFGAMLRSKL